MTVATNAIKYTAKASLKGKWLKSIITAVIPVFCAWINLYTASLTELFAGSVFSNLLLALMTAFFLFPVSLGCLRFFWRLIFECDDNPVSIFYYFSSKKLYRKTLKLLLSLIIKLLPLGCLLFLPSVIIWALSQNYLFELMKLPIPLWTRNLTYAIHFTRVLALCILLLNAVKYYIAPVLFVADENMEVAKALRMSSVISKNTSFDFIYLIFSFAGWIILSFFAIPLPFTLPYIITAYAVHVRYAITEYNQSIEQINSSKYPFFSVGA